MERHVVVVFPHPDDESFGCGGTIALFTQAGIPVTYVCGTLGQMGRNMGRPTFATRESLPHVREAELEEACKVLGIKRLIKLGLHDKTVEFEDPQTLADRIEGIIRQIQPSLVITHYPGYAVHPDHNSLGSVTIRAIGQITPDERPTVRMHCFPHPDLPPPDTINDISTVGEIKLAAIRAHRSQSEGLLARMETAEFKEGPMSNMAHNFLRRESSWTLRPQSPGGTFGLLG